MSEVEDDELENLSAEEIDTLPSAGSTYIFGINRRNNSHALHLPRELIQRISDHAQSDILLLSGQFNVDTPDSEPIDQIKPKR